jgi:pimeloyl-ACP methyl ester carboxylesterase
MSAEAVSPISTYFRVCDGVRVRFADNRADSDITVLLLAPWPETLWAFRRIWRRVSAVGRVVAIDMPGFGHSDGRPELIAPDASGAFLARLIDEWPLGSPHIVGPDVGTAAALFLAATTPERVTSLTIGGGAVRFPIEAGGALKDIIEAPSLDVVRGLDARANIGQAVEAAAGSGSEPRSPRGLCQRLRPRTLRGVGSLRAALPRTEPGLARRSPDDRYADSDPRRTR